MPWLETAPMEQRERFIRDHQLRGRMVTYFDWGEYAIWHLSPRVRVSLDGRRETVYSDRRIADPDRSSGPGPAQGIGGDDRRRRRRVPAGDGSPDGGRAPGSGPREY